MNSQDLSKELCQLQGIMYRREELGYHILTVLYTVPGGWIQGGDIVDGSKSGGESIRGTTIDGVATYCAI